MKYILNGKTPVPADMDAWIAWWKADEQDGDASLAVSRPDSNRRVALTIINDDITISTVFLGIDHQWGDGPPLLFETMVFGSPCDGEMDRYSTWEEAEAGHAAMVARVQAALDGAEAEAE